jgi:catechol 2,3-dioxygenase-like lactoylglutathione lyase family enzyme
MIGDSWETCHTAIAVDDLQAAVEWYRTALGVEFTEMLSFAGMPLVRPDGGEVDSDVRVVWSVGSDPPLELIQGPRGSIWDVEPGQHRIHHMAFWVEDFERESAILEEGGMALQLTMAPGRPPKGMAYHLHPSGFRVELMRLADKPAVDAWRAGGPLELNW